MDKQQMGDERPKKTDDKPRQKEATSHPAPQAGGQVGPGQMQATQFTDWASI